MLLWAASFFPRLGGVEVSVDVLLRTLPPLGIELLAIAPAEGDAPAEEVHAGVPIHRFAFQDALAARDIPRIARIRRQIAALKQAFAPDVVHVHAFHPGLFFHLRTTGARSVPQIVTLHGWPALDFGPDTVPGRLLRAADWVASCSASVLDRARRAVPEIGPVSSVVSNGVLPPPPRPPAPLPLDPPRILCLGRLVPEKGFDVAVAAVAALAGRTPAPELVIAGDGDARPSLERAVAARGLAGRTEFTGRIPPRAVYELLDRSTVVAVPSRGDEGFGLVALEAAMMGRPVVATALGGLPEVVLHGKTGLLVPENDPAALARAIAYLLDHPRLACRMGTAARRRAGRLFSAEAHAARYATLYRTLAEEVAVG